MLDLMRNTSVFLRFDRLRRAVNSRYALFLKGRFKLCLVSVLVALSLAVALVYSSSITPAPKPVASAENFPLKLTIELDKAVFKVGEIIPVRLSLRNLDNRIAQVTYPSKSLLPEGGKKDRVFGLYMQANEELMYIQTGGDIPATWTYSLDPNEEVSVTILWDQKTVKSDSQISPGTYSLIGKLPPGGQLASGGWIQVNGVRVQGIRTPPLTIAINSG